jgi:hypothetical protein
MVKTNTFEMLARDAKRQMYPSLVHAMLLLSRYGSGA